MQSPALRSFCAGPNSAAPASEDNEELELIYEGPMNDVVKRIKIVSVTTLSSAILLPAMALLFKSSASVSAMGKIAVGGTAMFAGVGSTFALHWCTMPFVFEMRTDGETVVVGPGDRDGRDDSDSTDGAAVSHVSNAVPLTVRNDARPGAPPTRTPPPNDQVFSLRYDPPPTNIE